jgi:hypothetical protein
MAEAFNYIAFGNREDVEGDIDSVEMSRGRVFEYTPPDIATRLEALDPTSLAFLEKLPTFLCSEIRGQFGAFSMVVKYGTLEAVSFISREVTARFHLLIDFGTLEFGTLDEARAIFGADNFQLYRTHWAVRLGDAQEILDRLYEIKPVPAPIQGPAGPAALDAQPEPPPRVKNTIGRADSVEDFLGILYGRANRDGTESFFRGHEDVKFELTPSLLRKWPNGDWQFMPSEDRLGKEVLIAHYDEFQGDQYCFDRLVRMQHYGLPTRLLDISSNPLVALFFACHGAPGTEDQEGEVIVVGIEADKVKYYDSDSVSCLSNLSNLTFSQKNEIDLGLEIEEFNREPVIGKLIHHIRSEKGFFEPRINPADLGSIICVKGKRNNSRIKSQSGAFLLFGHEAVLDEAGQAGVDIGRITIANKAHILDQLDRININITTVYPSIDQTAVHLRDRYKSSKPD